MNELKEADEALERGWLNSAQLIYSQAKKRIPREKLIRCGDVCVEQWFYTNFLREGYSDDWLESALRSYRIAKHEEGIAKVADCFISKDVWGRAFDICMSLKDKKKITEYSCLFFQNNLETFFLYTSPQAAGVETALYGKVFISGNDSKYGTIHRPFSADRLMSAVKEELNEIRGKIVSDFLEALI
jgi:hypothetical protein